MSDNRNVILSQAEKEVAETGTLRFSTRRRLWLELGPWEVREEDDPEPRSLTEPMRKRAELALSCAKKVSRVWSAYDAEDKRPQKLIKETRAYLDGKRTAKQLSDAAEMIEDFMLIVEDEPNSSAPCAGIAAWKALITALHDEPLLEERYADAKDSDLDSYDRDAAWEASEAWAGADEEAGPGKRKIRRMKFWVWYLEQTAKLLGDEEYRFPVKAVKDYQEKQNPPRPVPNEVTLESLSEYLETGSIRYCCRICAKNTIYDEKEPLFYHVVARHREDVGGICPKCRIKTTTVKYCIGGNALTADLPGGGRFMLVEEIPFYICPDHPNEWINASHEYINRKALFKKYISGEGRIEALEKQILDRAVNRFAVTETGVCLNDRSLDRFSIHVVEEGAIPGLKWLDRENDTFEVDVPLFGQNVVFLDMSYDEFVKKYPERVRKVAEQAAEIDFAEVWVKCFLDEKGALAKVRTTNRFCLQLKDPKRDGEGLAQGLVEALGLPLEQTESLMQSMGGQRRVRGEVETELLSGFSRTEAERVLKILRSHRVECRIMPWLINKEGDTWI